MTIEKFGKTRKTNENKTGMARCPYGCVVLYGFVAPYEEL